MKNKLSILIVLITWFAVLTQYYLMIDNKVTSILETTIRFFSFFTILTNLLVAIYFTLSLIKKTNNPLLPINKPGTLTAVTVYITIVGIVYQVLLRHTWEPKGAQKVVDELLHTVIPILVIVFWFLYEQKETIGYKQIFKWLIYPSIYLIYILIRGNISNFYPYPFIDVGNIGLKQVFINSARLILFFVFISAGYIKLGKIIKK